VLVERISVVPFDAASELVIVVGKVCAAETLPAVVDAIVVDAALIAVLATLPRTDVCICAVVDFDDVNVGVGCAPIAVLLIVVAVEFVVAICFDVLVEAGGLELVLVGRGGCAVGGFGVGNGVGCTTTLDDATWNGLRFHTNACDCNVQQTRPCEAQLSDSSEQSPFEVRQTSASEHSSAR